ncbi:MAG: heme o synthase [Planctomycetota bacterium]
MSEVAPTILDDARPAGDDASTRSTALAVYELTKPRMNFLVLVTTAVGFAAAAGVATVTQFAALVALAHTLLGTAFSAAGASVLNQWLEQDVDARMPRTQGRPLVTGELSPAFALGFGVALSVAGVVYLFLTTGPVPAMLSASTIALYVLVYTPMKRSSAWCTVVGAVPGALPPVIGVAAASGGEIGVLGVGLFGILFAWQMPHFYGLATMYQSDYAAGGLRMLPGEPDGRRRTVRQTIAYCVVLIPVSLLPIASPHIGWVYAVPAVLLGVWYLRSGIAMASDDSRYAAKRVFLTSIAYLPALLTALVIDAWI